MPIPKRPAAKAKDAAAADAFIEQAPDATKPARWMRGSKTQITVPIHPELLDRLDEYARSQYQSRAAIMTRWVLEGLARDASKEV